MCDSDTRSINGRGAVRLENDRICVFERNGVYQARIRTGANRYIWRSLKTRNLIPAISAARKLFHSIEYRQQSGLPIGSRSFNRVIDEYVVLRERQQTQGRTSIHMLRQIRRVVKFWREYIGDQSIESIGNKELSGYIEWRKSYYGQFMTLPKNAKLNPADKTLQWEMMLGKAIIRWAHEQGYRGDQPLPTFSFTPKKIRVRPAFELFEYRRLLRTLIKWQRDCSNDTWLHTRRLLTDYVLILANSGMRVGEANNLKIRDLETFEDDLGRRNYRFKVKGKTGERDVILRASAAKSVDRLLTRRNEDFGLGRHRLQQPWRQIYVVQFAPFLRGAVTAPGHRRVRRGTEYGNVGAGNSGLLRQTRYSKEVGDAVGRVIPY